MPLDIEFAQPARFEIRVSGEVTVSEIERAIDQLMVHPGLPGADALVDCNGVESMPSATELRAVARDIGPLIGRGFGAVSVVSSNPFVYGTARMFSVFAEAIGARIEAHRDLAEGQRWLEARRREAD